MKLHDIAKKIILAIGVSSLVIIAAGGAYYRSSLVFPFAGGVFLTSALNVLKVIMLGRNIERAVDMESKEAENFIRFQLFLRFLLTGLVLLIAVKTPFISLWGAAAGIFTLKIALFIMGFFECDKKAALST